MMRKVAGVAAGLVGWFLVASVANLLLRVSSPGYAEAEQSLNFTLGMLLARLAVGALSSVCAGLATTWIARGHGMSVKVLGVVLIALFIPVHYGLWDKFPLWYHLIFLASLLPLTLLGARLKAHPNPARSGHGNELL
jgi:hypothetical protein